MNYFYPDNLPITSRRDDIIAAVQSHQVTVIAGDTGSGKTTQLPKMCLEAFPDSDLLIGCTQPRRIATSTVAARVTEELGENGSMVGYKIRFVDQTGPSTKIKFMTDGVLLAETRHDRRLSRYGVIIVDEAHERSLNIDFLLGYLKQLIAKRKDLKVIITSATIDTEAFSRHFGNAPIITVSGRSYPVTVRYLPLPEDETDEKTGVVEHCVSVIRDLFHTAPPEDTLVFLPTERDIRECCEQLGRLIPNSTVLPMYGRLPASDQRRIFQKSRTVKIVVATNVAETSVTVPGIRYVIDSGLARISHYNVRAKTTSLPVVRISQASCDQRKGRCGRIGPGICIRLYSEDDYADRPLYTVPEIQRSNLAEVILQMISHKLGNPEKFPFIDPPAGRTIREGYRLLEELGAIDKKRKLTRTGHVMSDLPIDPCISRIIIEASVNNCLREIKIISAALAIQDPRVRPTDREREADSVHELFAHPHSDFMMLLNIWNTFHQGDNGSRSWSRLKKFCKTYYLSFQRMREWFDLHEQLDRIISRREGFANNAENGSYEQIHKSLLAGFARNLARKKLAKIYQGAHDKELMIFPGSHQFLQGGEWLVAASFLETNRLYALTVATIEPEWIEQITPHLCKYSWSNPRWHKKTGQVVADEAVSIFGLVISSGRTVNFGRRSRNNVREARNIFIHHALVFGELKGAYDFLIHNANLLEKWREAEAKLRSRSVIVDDLTLHEFYASRIPDDVYDQRTLNRFLKYRKNEKPLFMTEDEILLRQPGEKDLIDFPTVVTIGRLQIRLEYNFAPGSEIDGVTFRLPLEYAASAPEEVFKWLVPGLLPEKLTFLLKSLPKNIRKKLVPINETVNLILDDIGSSQTSLYAALEASILKNFKILIKRSDWTDELPLHLQPRYLLVDGAGKAVCTGRNLRKMLDSKSSSDRTHHKPQPSKHDTSIMQRWKGSEHSSWNFTELPKTLPLYLTGGEVAGFLHPVLVADMKKSCVRVEFESNPKKAAEINRRGNLYLCVLHFGQQFRALKKRLKTVLSGPSSLWLHSIAPSQAEIAPKVLDYVLFFIFAPIPEEIVSEKIFKETIARVEQVGFYQAASTYLDEFMSLLRHRRKVIEAIERIFAGNKQSGSFAATKKEVFLNLVQTIFPPSLLDTYPPVPMEDIDRQLQSLLVRLERFHTNPSKDEAKAIQLNPYLEKLASIQPQMEQLSAEALLEVHRFNTLINEFKISLFSPELGTKEPVSAKKLNAQWKKTLAKL